jgi:hypothetical protein
MIASSPPTTSIRRLVLATTILTQLLIFSDAQNTETVFLDRYNYDKTVERDDGFFDYGPKDWKDIKCDERTRESLDECIAYEHKWHEGIEWSIKKNHCRWCIPGNEENCGRDHQSPINLKRHVGLELGTHPNATECIDLHWMKYEDSTCGLEDLIDHKAFSIERHGLRIKQPIEVYEKLVNDTDGVLDGVRLDCRIAGMGSRFGRIDFSKGFSDWWYLSHMDVHVPSEHTQEGKRYDAEIQLYHFYSIPYDNEMATISVFLQAYEDAAPYRYLDKVICEWRQAEYETLTECGLDPIDSTYPGCFPLTRSRNLREKSTASVSSSERELDFLDADAADKTQQEERLAKKNRRIQTVADAIYYNDAIRDHPDISTIDIDVDDVNHSPAEDKDWEAYIAAQSEQMKQDEKLYHHLKKTEFGGQHTEDLHEKYRRLIQGDDLKWFNYWPMLGVRTEYYYRYRGSQTIPPCYGNIVEGSREGTNHWR